MSELSVYILDDAAFFKWGDTVHAAANWSLAQAPESLEARLLWTTQGRGTTDTAVVVTVQHPGPINAQDEWKFEIHIPPNVPPSYEGSLISVLWVIEVLTGDGKAFEDAKLVISPIGRVIRPPGVS